MTTQPPVAFQIDHLAYLRRRAYRRLIHAAWRREIRKRRQAVVTVAHEANGSCCTAEDWPTTSRRIQQALAADGSRGAWVIPAPGGVFVRLPKAEP